MFQLRVLRQLLPVRSDFAQWTLYGQRKRVHGLWGVRGPLPRRSDRAGARAVQGGAAGDREADFRGSAVDVSVHIPRLPREDSGSRSCFWGPARRANRTYRSKWRGLLDS